MQKQAVSFHPERPCRTAAEHVGRTSLTEHAFGRLSTDDVQSFTVIGAEKMGKTSFLNYLRQPEVAMDYLDNAADYQSVYLDAKKQNLSDEAAFFNAFHTEVEKLSGLTGLRGIGDLHQITDWLEQQDKRLIVMLDNFNLIVANPNYRVPFYEGLRSWFSTRRHVGCVVSSPVQLLQLSMARELSGSPFFNIFGAYTLEPLRSEEAHRLITERLPAHLQKRHEDIQQLIEAFGLNPYPLQRAGQAWAGMAGHQHVPPVSAVIEAGYQACLGHYESLYAGLKKRQLAVIDALLDPSQPPPDRIDNLLVERGWISADGKSLAATQMARFFRAKLGIKSHIGIWRQITIWLGKSANTGRSA
ncbi:MAG: hypothetical protein GY862_32885 [Gammaproteobacteria bacterium]|nr:hypothetical protein [Gammaproteobacteria bacterium]